MSLLGIDDRDGEVSRHCLLASTLAIEGFCKRRLLRRRHVERIAIYGGLTAPLGEYPVAKIHAVKITGQSIEPEQYGFTPGCGANDDIPCGISLSPLLRRLKNVSAIEVDYSAGYRPGAVPADLAAACLELVSWNMTRYRGRRIGMTGSVAGNWRDGEHLEMSMPENVVALLEPYRRKTI